MILFSPYRLRPLVEDDKYSIAKYGNNRRVWRNLSDSFPFPYTVADAENYIKFCQGTQDELNWCIDYQGEAIGMVGAVFQKGIRQKTCVLGYWIGEPFWGKGIMTNAVKHFVAYLFENFELERIETSVFEWNRGSSKVLEKVGFVEENRERDAFFKNNQLIDGFKFSLLRKQWEQQA